MRDRDDGGLSRGERGGDRGLSGRPAAVAGPHQPFPGGETQAIAPLHIQDEAGRREHAPPGAPGDQLVERRRRTDAARRDRIVGQDELRQGDEGQPRDALATIDRELELQHQPGGVDEGA